jgi:ABC-2 type transport system permease protein
MSLFRLLLFRFRLFLANFTRGEKKKRYVRSATMVIILATLVGFSFGAYGIFRLIGTHIDGGFHVAAFVVAVTFHALLVVAFIFDIVATANIFFLSSDLNLLMAAPLSTRKIFALKYVEAMGSGSVITLLLGLPALIGFGIAFGAPVVFYVAIAPVIVAFLSVPVSFGTLCGLIISRFVPPARVKEVLGLVGGLLGLGLWLATQLLRRQLGQADEIAGFGDAVKAAALYGDHVLLRWLPSRLTTGGMTSLASGDASGAAFSLLVLALIASAMIGVSISLAERMYTTGWSRVSPGVGKARTVGRRDHLYRIFSWLPSVERAILSTTTRLFMRDPQQVMPIITITIIMSVFPIFAGRSRSGPVLTPSVLLMSLLAVSFVGSLQLAANATVIDGRSFWITLSAPCSAKRKLASKLLVSVFFFVPLAFVITLAFLIAGILDWAHLIKLVWIAASVSCMGGGFGILLAVYYGDWEWDIPRKMLRTSGRLVMAGVMVCFFIAFAVAFSASSGSRGISISGLADWIVFPSIGLLAAAVTSILIRLSAAKVERMEWKL